MTDAAHTTPARPRRNRASERVSKPTLVSGSKLAEHFGVSRQFVDQLVQQGVIARRRDNLFDQDVSRLKYLDHLRSQHRRSPRAEADGELAKARAEWLRLRTLERTKELVPAAIFDQAINELAGATMVTLASIPARLFPHAQNLAERRRCEAVIFQVRQELAAKALGRAKALEAAEARAKGQGDAPDA